jgi:hypothetical protein
MSSARDKNSLFSMTSDDKKARKQQEKERKLREKLDKKIADTGRELEQLEAICKEQKRKTDEAIDKVIKAIRNGDTTPISAGGGRQTPGMRG